MVTLKKYHGLGNDYLIYDPNQNRELLQERQIQLLCRRNTGVGADGILSGPLFENEKIKVRIFNPDGSEAERSGNGIRIFSKYLKDAGYVKEKCYELWTKAGPVQVEFLDEDASRMKVDMGYAAFALTNERMPVTVTPTQGNVTAALIQLTPQVAQQATVAFING